jgi:hypothetical protein
MMEMEMEVLGLNRNFAMILGKGDLNLYKIQTTLAQDHCKIPVESQDFHLHLHHYLHSIH